MTLDELIERLQQLRRDCPAAGTAHITCGGDPEGPIVYDHGEVWIGSDSSEGEVEELT